MALENYYINQIDYKTAMDIIVSNHYLHRKAPCSKAFGLFNGEDELVGVVCYGTPASRSLQVGVCGREEANNVIELTRLWVDDKVPKNGESFLIGNTIRNVDKDILVSYADSTQNHIGYVYQATNWTYTGLSDAHVEWRINGLNGKHSRHKFDELGGVNKAKQILGDAIVRYDRPRKHRYIYINAKGRRREELLSKLKYPVLPYPKFDNPDQKVV